MRILKIENLFQSEETLEEVLNECKDSIDKVDYYSNLLKTNVIDNAEEVKKALNELTGIYMDLKTILLVANTEKKNREIRYYDQLRIDIENEGRKFVSAPAEKEASTHVAKYRRIRNIIQAYVDVSEKAISTCQSILKYMGEEIKLQK